MNFSTLGGTNFFATGSTPTFVADQSDSLRPVNVTATAGIRQFLTDLDAALEQGASAPSVLQAAVRSMVRNHLAESVWLALFSTGAKVETAESPVRIICLSHPGRDDVQPSVSPRIQSLVRKVLDTGEAQIERFGNRESWIVIQLKHSSGGSKDGAMEFLVARTQSESPDSSLAALRLAAGTVDKWRQERLLEITSEHAQAAHRMVGLCKSVSESTDPESAFLVTANQLQAVAQANQVCLLRCDEDTSAKLVSVSGVESFDPNSPAGVVARKIATAISKDGNALVWQQGDNEIGMEDLAIYARESGNNAVICVPAAVGRDRHYVFLFGFSRVEADWTPVRKRLQQVSSIAAGQLHQAHLANLTFAHRWTRDLRKLITNDPGRKIFAGCLALAIILLIPVPYQVKCKTRLEPTARRYVASPFEAILEKALVKNGDTVTEGQVIAILDGRQLRIEQSVLQAEIAATRKKHDAALGSGDVPTAQVAKNELRKVEAKMEQIQKRLGQLELRSPVSGIVVSGDLDNAQGVTLKTGDSLFEIGTLERVRADVLVPESELRHVREGATATVYTDAFPFDSWQGTVNKIHQRSEIIDNENCFVAEVELPNDDGRLRAGMKGSGKIRSSWHCLGWIWTHRAFEKSRHWFVW